MYLHHKARRLLITIVFFSTLLFSSMLFLTTEQEENPVHTAAISLHLPGEMVPFVLSVDNGPLLFKNSINEYWPVISSHSNLFFIDWGEEGENQGWGPFEPVMADVEPTYSFAVYDYEEFDGTLEGKEGGELSALDWDNDQKEVDDPVEELVLELDHDPKGNDKDEEQDAIKDDDLASHKMVVEQDIHDRQDKEEEILMSLDTGKSETQIKQSGEDTAVVEEGLKEKELVTEELSEEEPKEKELEEAVADSSPDRVFTHQVKAGDTLWSIAHQYDIDVDTIVGANSQLENANRLRIGQTLQIPGEKGIFHEVYRGETLWEISRIYSVTVEELVAANNLSANGIIQAGDKLFVPGASPAQRPVRYMWPVTGPISSYFGPRWGRMHEGIDIVVPVGSQVRATRSGRVTVSSWMGGYGYAVYIDHGNGISSRYAHNSRLLVRPGEYVSQGQVIALSGSTGQSTGPHVHFEIRVNGIAQNPLNYLNR